MQIPVHKDNLLSRLRVKQVGKYIHVTIWYYGDKHVEIWKKFLGPYYLWQETKVIKTPKVKRK